MSRLEAVVAVVKALAWPATVLIAVMLLRKNIAGLIDRVKRVTGPAGTSAEFESKAAATEKAAEVAIPVTPPELPVAGQGAVVLTSLTLPDLLAEAHDRPNAAIIIANALLEQAAKVTFRYDPQVESLERFFRRLVSENLVAPLTPSVARGFERLYDQVANGEEFPSREAAENLVSTAWRLKSAIRQADLLRQHGSGWTPEPQTQ